MWWQGGGRKAQAFTHHLQVFRYSLQVVQLAAAQPIPLHVGGPAKQAGPPPAVHWHHVVHPVQNPAMKAGGRGCYAAAGKGKGGRGRGRGKGPVPKKGKGAAAHKAVAKKGG